MFTHYYFEGPETEIFTLRTRLNDIFKSKYQPPSERDKELAALGLVRDDGSHDLVHILDALEGPKSIWHDGSVCKDIASDACRPLRSGTWSMAVNVDGGNCCDLWNLVIQKWAPNSRYYYLAYGDFRDGDAESNDVQHRYFSGDYAVRASLSKETPDVLARIFRRHTLYQYSDSNIFSQDHDVYYSQWPRQELHRELLTLVPMPELSPDDLADVVASTIGLPLGPGRFGTRAIIRRIHYRVRKPHHYFMPALEELRQKGQLR